jgi:hypothetical protein
MQKKIVLALFVMVTTFGIYFAVKINSVPTITYFPLEYGTSFVDAETKLENTNEDGSKASYSINWDVTSKTEEVMYLRQDVSLLFGNGQVLGMRSQWKEDADTIHFSENIKEENELKWESITFHYGEIHKNEDSIRSIQKLSQDTMFVIKENNAYNSFHKPETTNQANSKAKLDTLTQKKLLAHWQDLLFHFHLDINDYYSIPLTDLYEYQAKAFPSFDKRSTDRIMGQLWEGIYKNYIIPYIGSKEKLEGYIPLILIEKEGNHLLVLFEMNGQKEKLIQKIR